MTLILGFVLSQASDHVRERRERERIVVQRAADVEGEALLHLQDLLIELPDRWVKFRNKVDDFHERGGEIEPEDIYEIMVELRQPYDRAKLLASRIESDELRGKVHEAIAVAFPFRTHDVSLLLGGSSRHPYKEYPYPEALEAVGDASEAIGRRLRQPSGSRLTRPRPQRTEH